MQEWRPAVAAGGAAFEEGGGLAACLALGCALEKRGRLGGGVGSPDSGFASTCAGEAAVLALVASLSFAEPLSMSGGRRDTPRAWAGFTAAGRQAPLDVLRNPSYPGLTSPDSW